MFVAADASRSADAYYRQQSAPATADAPTVLELRQHAARSQAVGIGLLAAGSAALVSGALCLWLDWPSQRPIVTFATDGKTTAAAISISF